MPSESAARQAKFAPFNKPTGYDYGVGRMPEDVRTAECHTFATGESYPDLCMAEDCPAREYLR